MIHFITRFLGASCANVLPVGVMWAVLWAHQLKLRRCDRLCLCLLLAAQLVINALLALDPPDHLSMRTKIWVPSVLIPPIVFSVVNTTRTIASGLRWNAQLRARGGKPL